MEYLGTSDAVEAYWNAALPHLQAHFCHSTLGTKIKIERVGGFKHYEGKKLLATFGHLNEMMEPTAEDIGTADLMAYMSHDATSNATQNWGVVGVARLGVICGDHKSTKLSIIEWMPTASEFGFVMLFSES